MWRQNTHKICSLFIYTSLNLLVLQDNWKEFVCQCDAVLWLLIGQIYEVIDYWKKKKKKNSDN